jgi:ADP-L-glycero-D-manno-heptose 6-epimerase
MPNTPAAIGAGVTGWCSLAPLSAEDRALIVSLLGAIGREIELPEAQIDALMAVSGCGPAFVFEFTAALRDAGVAAGLSRDQAQLLALETVLGAARLMARTHAQRDHLRRTAAHGGPRLPRHDAGNRPCRQGALRGTQPGRLIGLFPSPGIPHAPPAMSPLSGRILVTGGAGFIGSALVWALNQRGLTNIVITDLLGSDEKWRNLAPLRFADYLEAGEFRRRLRESPASLGTFSCVFHLGACSATTERNASYLIDNNFEYTKELARWAVSTGARFIYASSAATYGDGSRGMDDRLADLSQLRPLNMYGYSKHLFDLWADREGLLNRIVGVKYFNVFGPNEDHKGEMRSLVHKAFQQIQSTGIVQLFRSHRPDFRDGEQQRDFLYVKDAVEMTLHFADRAPEVGGLFNLGSGQANTWLTLARALFTALQREPRIEFIDMPEVLRGKYQYFTLADIGKLRASGYAREMTPLSEAVRDYVQGHLVTQRHLGE